ncbi:MAG: phage portal protein [Oscillospiraceae bacterium]|nr:phage portal protein [Oscillospiraceae bacterium]MBQ8996404.1 phage portal protein [Oscillospiraceae bacterium]
MTSVEKAKPMLYRGIQFLDGSTFAEFISSGRYISLADCPEIQRGCLTIAEMISSMTIYLMANTENGDKRIKNELSRKIDINPSKWMTRRTWMTAIVMNLLLYGRGNSIVLPHTWEGLLEELEVIRADRVRFEAKDQGYNVYIDKAKKNPDNLLHFVWNPDPKYPWKGRGVTFTLHDVADNLKQAEATTKAFMESKWKPSVVVKVDALTDEFADPAGRKKLLESYVESAEVGEPWLIPAEQFSVDQIRPLTLADLAIDSMMKLEKETVAAILGIPAFVLGVGTYSQNEWNAFINNTIRPIAQEIEQEMTRKLILSDKMYLRFNIASLYAYDLQTVSSVYTGLYVRGIVTGNEVREKMGLEAREGLDDLVILENYIPLEKVGDQLKLSQE